MKPLAFRQARIARHWSNTELRKVSCHLAGDIVNVSGWEDGDKQGGKYRDYFPRARTYLLSNYGGERGSAEEQDQFELDLEAELPHSLYSAFDVVFCHTVLEHVYDLRLALENLCLMSRDAVIVVVPFVQEQHFTESFGDYWRFTPMAIERLFAGQGLTSLYVRWNHDRNASTYIFCLAVRDPDKYADLKLGDHEGRLGRNAPRHPGAWVGEPRWLFAARALKRMFSGSA